MLQRGALIQPDWSANFWVLMGATAKAGIGLVRWSSFPSFREPQRLMGTLQPILPSSMTPGILSGSPPALPGCPSGLIMYLAKLNRIDMAWIIGFPSIGNDAK